jgi:nucleoside-diphosphate-sugar epimerase
MTVHHDAHALVIGASGIIGWSVVNQLLQPYPSSSPFRKVTALTNRAIELENSFWPQNVTERPDLSLASGVNLLCEDDEFEKLLKEKVDDVETITHVYYFGELMEKTSTKKHERLKQAITAFKEVKDQEKEVATNVGMLRRVVRAVNSLSRNLRFVVYPGGTRVGRLSSVFGPIS